MHYLKGRSFVLAVFWSPFAGDDAHCQGCWAKFADYDGPGILREGYATTLPLDELERQQIVQDSEARGHELHPAFKSGVDLYWVCPSCFSEFSADLALTFEGSKSVETLWVRQTTGPEGMN
jgi:hypothetical protein